MIPLRAQRRSSRPSWATWSLVAVCVAVLVRLALLPDDRATAIFEALAVIPARLLADPFDPGQLLTLVSSAFLHAGWIHLLGNMLFLWVFGPGVEDRLGAMRFLTLYLVAGVAGALCFVALNPTSPTPLVGASAAIAGVLGAYLVLEPHSQVTTAVPLLVYFEIAALPASFVIGLWFLLQVASAVAPVVPGLGGSVAWTSHLAGFAAGVGLAFAMKRRRTRNRPARGGSVSRR